MSKNENLKDLVCIIIFFLVKKNEEKKDCMWWRLKRNYDVCNVTRDILVAGSRHKPITFELQYRRCMIPLEARVSVLICTMPVTIDNYFSITHLFDVCIASFEVFFNVYRRMSISLLFFFWLDSNMMCVF